MDVEWLQDDVVCFEDLDIGSTFVVDHIPYIKISKSVYNGTGINAVSLCYGKLAYFENDDYVTEAHFKLVEI